MTARDSARHALRTATAADHDAVDRAFGRYDLSDRAAYAAFLQAQAAAFLPVEGAVDRSDPERVVADWTERRRSDALRADLAALGEETPASAPIPPFASEAALLGAVYVLEGSRLGGRMLAREVPDAFPQAFLAAGNPALWRSLLAVLELNLDTGERRAAAIEAARGVFALFEKGARVDATHR